MAAKQQEEDKLKQGVASDPKKKQEFGDPWAEVAKAESTYKQIFLPLTYLERRLGLRGDLAGFARILVRAAAEKPKPNGERLREYRESALPSLEQQLFSTAPIYKDLETAALDGIASPDAERSGQRSRRSRDRSRARTRRRRQGADRGHEAGRCRRPQAAL